MLHTCEPVIEGYPDKVADYVADSILAAHLAEFPATEAWFAIIGVRP